MNGAELVGKHLRVSEPLTIRRPFAGYVAIPHLVGVLIDTDLLAGIEVDVPEGGETVDERDLFAVGREARRGVKAGLECNLANFASAVLRAEVESVLAGFVGQVSDRFAVGRPTRLALHDAGRIRKIAGVAFFCGYCEDLTPNGEGHTGGIRRKRREAQLFGDIDEARAQFGEVALNVNGDRLRFAGFEVVKVNAAELLVDNGVRSEGCRLEIEATVGNGLMNGLGLDVVGVEGDWAVAVGKEVDVVAGPHGVEVVGVRAGYFGDCGIREFG
jgi:hypothetical protein